MNLKPFRRIDDRRAFAAIAVDYAVVVAAAGAALWIHHVATTLIAFVIIAGRQSALQGLVHSACHWSLFSKRKRNETLQFLFAFPILDSVVLYRRQHLEHHRDFSLKRPDRFDYLHDVLQLSRDTMWARTWIVFVRPVLGHAGYVFVSDVATTYLENPKQGVVIAAYWLGLLTAAWSVGALWPLLVYWVVPLVWLYPVLDIWAELSDHLDAESESRNQEGFFYSFLFKGHETYHAVHHLYPVVPFYRLRDLNQKLRETGVALETSRGPRDFLSIVYRSKHTRAPAAAGIRPST